MTATPVWSVSRLNLKQKHVIHHSSQRMVSSIIPAKLKYTKPIHIIILSIPNICCCQHFGISDNWDIKFMKKLKFWPRITCRDWPSLQQVDLTLEKKCRTYYACKSPWPSVKSLQLRNIWGSWCKKCFHLQILWCGTVCVHRLMIS